MRACRKHLAPAPGCELCRADTAADRVRARNEMTYEEFVTAWALSLPAGLRYGQQLFNTLHKYRPELAEQLRETDSGADPYYDDLKLAAAFEWIRERWA